MNNQNDYNFFKLRSYVECLIFLVEEFLKKNITSDIFHDCFFVLYSAVSNNDSKEKQTEYQFKIEFLESVRASLHNYVETFLNIEPDPNFLEVDSHSLYTEVSSLYKEFIRTEALNHP
jgi:hypothetical protein